MMLLTAAQTNSDAYLLFGLGLLGSAIATELQSRFTLHAEHLPLDWSDEPLQQQQLLKLRDKLAGLPSLERLSVLWSAGRAGFSAQAAETARELRSYERVVQLLSRFRQDRPDVRTLVVHLSSAGGLYTGQRYVSSHTTPTPGRLYGQLKLAQERLLEQSDSADVLRIYRLTSVFGFLRPGQRRGLIPTLILNGLRQRVSYISGYASTLRDYIWIEDLARFLANALHATPGPPARCTAVLGSAKPTSILEIQRLVERELRRKLYIDYLPGATNSEDITISAQALAPGWYPSELALNIRRVASDAVGRGSAFLPTLG